MRFLTPEQLTRARALLTEGLPVTWVAEEIGARAAHVYPLSAEIPDREEHVRAWLKTWGEIRRNPTLVALHRAFNPTDPRKARRAA